MELSSSLVNTCKLCLIVSFFGSLFLLLLLNQNYEYTTTFSSPQNTIAEIPYSFDNDSESLLHQSSQSLTTRTASNTIEQQQLNLLQTNLVTNPDTDIPLNEDEEQNNYTTSKNEKCNIFEGKWVYKPEENPLYDIRKCPFIEEKMGCQRNGRPDSEYEKWGWEATDCDIPLFKGTDMLERLRNKRVVVVGDSLNRNMWESLACLLYTSVPSSSAEVQIERSDYKELKLKEYNTTVEFHWSPFLIEYNVKDHESGKKVIILDKMSPNSKLWLGADVMVFNSGHWWTHKRKISRWDLIQYKGKLLEEMPIRVAYTKGMKTWVKWIEENVDPTKTIVFFRSISAQHNTKQWCYNSTQPIMDESYKNMFPKSHVNVIEHLINKMSKPKVQYLNITKLSGYRIDAHPSVYKSLDYWNSYTSENTIPLKPSADCSHWCLPGLPDTWNRLLYASLFYDIPYNLSFD